ncbi:hypothetical protein SARC_06677 [Sphaeroforma arctica JP610]|uniref:Alpha 1,4-glycosyltransferase domain-containing protein n=1 Tax=Sphaeroforma arctica JP610 TaxID=667725 RepID=A0A0L0FWN9_9EUKA|nr:hypothetical protein SARC_06677 [Sphaeroforma arctica JP610]KNC80976.1 hypothetical protein SARC_06677 [Sphaeroforma arctica JP610]|eukprot:XP_014154878.1 hypothetical protein SARC_06677 [Sphaeroforma arctica JP610]
MPVKCNMMRFTAIPRRPVVLVGIAVLFLLYILSHSATAQTKPSRCGLPDPNIPWVATLDLGENMENLKTDIGKFKSEDLPPCKSLFMIWTTDKSTWQDINSVSLESVFHYFPCARITVYANELAQDFFDEYTNAGFHIRVERYNLTEITRGKPGGKWVTKTAKPENRSPFHSVHESDFLRTFMLYYNGGSYIDLDHFMLPLSVALTPYKNIIGAEECEADNSGKTNFD